MATDYEIVKEKVSTTQMGRDGNWFYYNEDCNCFLKNEDDEIISHQYECMLDLGSDHLAVCKIVDDIRYLMDGHSADDRYYDIIHGEYEIKSPKLKWGIIRLNRDERGLIIPGAETLVVPYLYDRISENNLKSATAYCDDKLTYLDIDRTSWNYGRQLVPCILEHAVPFSVQHNGFAECSINGIVGFLPRNCQAKENIEGVELLTNEQALLLSKYFNSEESFLLDTDTISAYFNLTGIRLEKEKVHTLSKKKKQEC